MFNFRYRGGVMKPTEHTNEKFLAFFLLGDQEVPLYQMLREGFISLDTSGIEQYSTNHPVLKIFTSQQGFGIQKRYHSFYIRLDNTDPEMEVLPFSERQTGYYFKARAHLMARSEVLELLPKNAESRIFFERQKTLSINMQQKMVLVDRTKVREGIRTVVIGRRKGGGK